MFCPLLSMGRGLTVCIGSDCAMWRLEVETFLDGTRRSTGLGCCGLAGMQRAVFFEVPRPVDSKEVSGGT